MPGDPVVTGLGAIGPWGLGREPLAAALASGRPIGIEVDRASGFHRDRSARRAALVPPIDLGRWLPPAQARRMAAPSRWSVAAARMALEDAGLPSAASRRACVVMATAFGSVLFTERLVRQVIEEGPEAAQPFYFSECVANAAAAQVGLSVEARGANVTITQHEAGPLLALAHAAAEVREGRADLALAGATDEMTPLLHALLDRYGALAREAPGRAEAPRPFDRRRDGFLAGEGAVVLVVERETAARARGARMLARIANSASAFDPTATESDWGTGDVGLAAALLAAWQRDGFDSGAITGVVSGASGARRGDALEGRVLRRAWGENALPPVVAPKGVVGEYGGGILGSALAAVGGAPFGALESVEEQDPAVRIGLHAGALPPGAILVTALAAGGAAAWVVLERP